METGREGAKERAREQPLMRFGRGGDQKATRADIY